MKINDIVSHLETIAPLSFQESYDNSGLIIGDIFWEVTSVLITIDTTEEIIDEAIRKRSNLIISHHPIIFDGLKKLTGKNYIERTVIKAIKNNLAIYVAHTNLDKVVDGVNAKICEKLNLQNIQILSPLNNELRKLVTFVPLEYAGKVREEIFKAGAGNIGNYDQCSFNLKGQGTFRPSEEAKPFVGNKGKLHFEDEIRIETIFPKYLQSEILNALLKAHPYNEVAYDIYSLENQYNKVGMGMIGELDCEIDEISFLRKLKQIFKAGVIRYTNLRNIKVKRIVVCGGSGSLLLKNAMAANADVFVSADFKYHQFFEAENKILVVDIGHFESEQFTKEVIYEILSKKFPNFAFYMSAIKTNPINYM